MIRILIVDDEILVRIGLKTIIPMDNEEYEIIGEASNGLEALDILEQQDCDIALIDIRMPDMDGLELLRQIRQSRPAIKCLILSNHDDFAYVQQALRLGAAEYIIKLEIDPAELMQKIGQMKQQIQEEKQQRAETSQLAMKVNQYGREVKAKRWRELLLGQCSTMEAMSVLKEFMIAPFPPKYRVVKVQIEYYEAVLADNRFKSERLLNYTVANVLEEIMKKYGYGEFVEIENGKFAIIKDILQAEMLQEMARAVSTFLRLSVGFGVSAAFGDLSDLHKAYQMADDALSYRFYLGRGQIIHAEQIPRAADPLPDPWPEEDWIRCIEERNLPGIRERLAEWLSLVQNQALIPPGNMRDHWIRLMVLFDHCLQKEGRGDIYSVDLHDGIYPYHSIRTAETLQDLADWFGGWLDHYFAYMKEHDKRRLRPEIETIIRTIHEQISMPLKVNELASQVGFTVNYLSILFKRETGETITDYIARVRMKKAREMLKNPEMKIYEISELTGYADPNHFSRSFKQIEGMYPTEFRKLYLGKTTGDPSETD